MLNQTDLEQLAGQIRAKGMQLSWDELLEFCESVIGNLVDAYKILLQNHTSSSTPSAYSREVLVLLQKKMAKALGSLASQEYVKRWESEILAGDVPGIPKTD